MVAHFVTLVLAMLLLGVNARPTFVQRIPNSSSVSSVRALGHQNPNGGGATNVFGEGFEAAGFQWTPAFCKEDSDGDGATNGEELGDPCCTWRPGGSVTRSTSITHPGVPNTFSDHELTAMRCESATKIGENNGLTINPTEPMASSSSTGIQTPTTNSVDVAPAPVISTDSRMAFTNRPSETPVTTLVPTSGALPSFQTNRLVITGIVLVGFACV